MLARDSAGVDASRYAEYATTASTNAAVLRSVAIRISGTEGRIGRAVALAKFQSPSAARFKDRTQDLGEGLRETARRLSQTAEELDRLSRQFQQRYDEWRAGHA
ncbi:hypothetical protein Rhe02_65920 [Rhizocola hellebori]|uniref:Uncharacterized protein n=1 Tax=Rhizocola hellebori TaxID=1392758 RepID=A0A8J3QFA1_9ACTN|nr:hypothetical protein [Rhizocola hellebori]GIH08525.1 hypothetical protein Rhe02_65920 [Rhizocola hellebori]